MNATDVAESPQEHIPLKPDVLHILIALSGSDLHGYGIIKEVLERTGGAFELQPGALYRRLRTLREAGMIRETQRRPAADQDDERRRYYRITSLGRRVAAAEARRMEALVEQARARGLIAESGSGS